MAWETNSREIPSAISRKLIREGHTSMCVVTFDKSNKSFSCAGLLLAVKTL